MVGQQSTSSSNAPSRRARNQVAAIAVILGIAYMAIASKGNITKLFYTGTNSPLPLEIEKHTSRVNDATGFDGQFYHVIAHDPLLQKGYERYVDNPSMRWRRIAVPAIAAVTNPDWGFLAIQIVCAFIGVWLVSAFAGQPYIGLSFLAIPSVAVSIDRMTIDLPLATATIAFAFLQRGRAIYPVLAVAPLIRETGILLTAGWCLWNAKEKRWREVLAGAATAIPTLAWWAYVAKHTPPDGTKWLAAYPFSGLVERLQAGFPWPTSLWLKAATITEALGLAGVLLAIACVAYLMAKRRTGLLEITAVLFLAFMSMIGKYDVWDGVYSYGRTLSPLLALLLLLAIRDRKPVYAIPILLMLPRIALQYEAQLALAFRT